MARIGIIGGGQLARMMQQAAIGLGIDVRLLTEAGGSSAAQVIPKAVVGDYTSYDELARFAQTVDAITFDHEHVPTKHLEALADRVQVRPGPHALRHAQDKAEMRQRLTALGLPCPQFQVMANAEELRAFGEKIGWPVIAKTSRGGYDGKGVWLVQPDDVAEVFRDLPAESAGEPVRILAEEYIDFHRELSALVVRSPEGQAVAYPISHTVQEDGICVETITPAPELSDEQAVELQEMALRIAQELDVVGVLAVELMQAKNGQCVVNELAMRPHNTGHWSIDGAITSQFHNHMRAVLNLPLGSPEPRAPYVVMRNILGGTIDDLPMALQHVYARDREIAVHLYGKDVKPGRKVGHVTAYGHDLDDVLRRARHAAGYLMGDPDA